MRYFLLTFCITYLNFHAPTHADLPVQPNVLVILADDLGYSDLGCYGSQIETPHLDALAGRGIRLTNFYNTARCWPTRAALLTGYYPQQIGFDVLPAEPQRGLRSLSRRARPTWASLLPTMIREAGYRSYHSGKWHLKAKPVQAGFDRSYLLKDQGRFFHPQVHFLDDEKLPAVSPEEGYYGTTAIADHAIEVLTEHAKKHSKRPFFHFLAFTAPHFPLHALPADIEKYDGVFDEGWDAARQRRWQRLIADGVLNGQLPEIERHVGPPYRFPDQIAAYGAGEITWPVPWKELNDTQREFQADKMEIHAAMVDRMDQEIGRVMVQLKQMGVFDNTLILFLSDNGGSAELMIRADGHDPDAPMGSAATHLCLGPGWSMAANTPFRRHKTWVHEGGCHTPLIAHWPAALDGIPKENRSPLNHSLCHVIDIVPTILELAGCPVSNEIPTDGASVIPPTLPGRSFAPVFLGKTLSERELWWCHEGHCAYRDGKWKLVRAKDEPWELYDILVDPTETIDLATQFPERVKALKKSWQIKAGEMREIAIEASPDRTKPSTAARSKTK